MNYEQDIQIDDTALDIEWLEQPSLMFKYARNAANARKTLDITKENLDVVRAGLDKLIRESPSTYGVDKITEGAIQAVILTQDKYKAANKAFLDAKYDVDIAQAAVIAISQRKDALENLVRLHGQQYFAGPKLPRDLHGEREERQKNVDGGIANKLRQRQKGI